ncbi:MAG: hypothetical protein DWQ07_14000 [Chloroflexi bacterium]|nr:MAG: hypothetical protein DWQ07_14000 [Chloroflexota bacterium]
MKYQVDLASRLVPMETAQERAAYQLAMQTLARLLVNAEKVNDERIEKSVIGDHQKKQAHQRSEQRNPVLP